MCERPGERVCETEITAWWPGGRGCVRELRRGGLAGEGVVAWWDGLRQRLEASVQEPGRAWEAGRRSWTCTQCSTTNWNSRATCYGSGCTQTRPPWRRGRGSPNQKGKDKEQDNTPPKPDPDLVDASPSDLADLPQAEQLKVWTVYRCI